MTLYKINKNNISPLINVSFKSRRTQLVFKLIDKNIRLGSVEPKRSNPNEPKSNLPSRKKSSAPIIEYYLSLEKIVIPIE